MNDRSIQAAMISQNITLASMAVGCLITDPEVWNTLSFRALERHQQRIREIQEELSAISMTIADRVDWYTE